MVANIDHSSMKMSGSADLTKIFVGQKAKPYPQRDSDNSVKSDTLKGLLRPNVSLRGETDRAELEAAVKDISQNLEIMQTKIAVKLDENVGMPVMQVIDMDSGEVIKQVPPEEILKIKEAFKDVVKGFLLNEEA